MFPKPATLNQKKEKFGRPRLGLTAIYPLRDQTNAKINFETATRIKRQGITINNDHGNTH